MLSKTESHPRPLLTIHDSPSRKSRFSNALKSDVLQVRPVVHIHLEETEARLVVVGLEEAKARECVQLQP
jgi:hypothetical protein